MNALNNTEKSTAELSVATSRACGSVNDRSLSRLDFLRGGMGTRKPPFRPPWALPETLFIEACDRCGACIKACPERILVEGRGGFPETDFTHGGCTFCGACATACVPAAIARPGADARGWPLVAAFGAACLAKRDVECRVCGERCEARAIRFKPRIGSPAEPDLRLDRCTGCGACVSACPARAVAMTFAEEPA